VIGITEVITNPSLSFFAFQKQNRIQKYYFLAIKIKKSILFSKEKHFLVEI